MTLDRLDYLALVLSLGFAGVFAFDQMAPSVGILRWLGLLCAMSPGFCHGYLHTSWTMAGASVLVGSTIPLRHFWRR